MTAHRHARKLHLAPRGPSAWILALIGSWSLVTSGLGDAPRYEHVVVFLLSGVILASGIVPTHLRPAVRRGVSWLAAFLLGLAGVMDAVSLDEAFTLATGSALAQLASVLFKGPRPRARHAAI